MSPVLTAAAGRFVGALTFSALGSEPAQSSLWEGPEAIAHTVLARRADLIVIVPATARFVGAYAAGISSDLLISVLLATRAPVVVCPAMHTEMWEHPAVVENLATLARRGVHLVPAVAGPLAGGDVGPGRLAEPADIVAAAARILAAGAELAGVTAVVTAGGTREPIDAVRYMGNRSSGKQAHAVAEELARRGAEVRLITTTDRPVPGSVAVTRVETAAEMEAAVGEHGPGAQIVVMAAAVADFRPRSTVGVKLKKDAGIPEVVLEATPDILAGLGRRRRPGQVLVGFAAETLPHPRSGGSVGPAPDGTDGHDGLIGLARIKLAAKHADLIVANDVAAPHTGFAHDTNAVVIVDARGATRVVELADKRLIAVAVIDAVVAYRRGGMNPGESSDGAGRRPSPTTPQEHT